MSFLHKLEKRNVRPLQQASFVSLSNFSGETVTETSALGVAAVFSAVGLLADSVASLPLEVFNTTDGRMEPLPVPVWITDPSSVATGYELMHGMVSSMALHGNAYAVIERNARYETIGLTALHPGNVTVQAPDGRTRRYYVTGAQVDAAAMLHLRWWTPPQYLTGISPLEEHKTTFGLAMAVQRHLAQFYANGSIPGSVLETDAQLSAEQAQILRDTWEQQHQRQRRPAVLTQGLKWRAIGSSAGEMELNATREHQVNEVARVFRIPPHMIGGKGDSQTYANVESQNLSFLQHTLRPWLVRIEQAITGLLPAGQVARFNVDELLRADQLTRYRAHQLGIMSGILTPNEARQVERRAPYATGDEFVMALPGAPMATPNEDNPLQPPVGVDTNPVD